MEWIRRYEMSISIGFFSLLVYLALTAGSGGLILWSFWEISFGVVFAFLTALGAKKLFEVAGVKPSLGFLNPVKWVGFITYLLGPFLFQMAKANLDVAYRVVTGNIKPGIVKINPGLKTDFGLTMLANSITLTPGTLSVDVDGDKNLYVHWLWVKDKEPRTEDVCSNFPKWVRWLAE